MYLPMTMVTCCPSLPDESRPAHLHHVYVDVERQYAFATDGCMAIRVPIEPEKGEVTGYCSQDAVRFAAREDGHVLHLAAHTLVRGVTFPNPEPREPGQTAITPYPVQQLMDWFAQPRPGRVHVDARRLLRLAAALQSAEHAAVRNVTIAHGDDPWASLLVTPWHEGTGRVAEALLMPIRPPKLDEGGTHE